MPKVTIAANGASDPITLDSGAYALCCSGDFAKGRITLQANYGAGWANVWVEGLSQSSAVYPYPIYGPGQLRGYMEFADGTPSVVMLASPVKAD